MPKRKTPKTSRPTPIARPTSGRGTPGPKCGHNQSGQRWSTEECSALEEGIDFHGTAWVKVVEHLSTYGISRTVAMCRNRWQRRTADTSGATNTCQVCNAFPAKGHSCPGGVDVAPKAAGQIGPPGNAFGSAFGAPRDAILSKQIVHVVGTSMSRTGKEAQEENVVSNLRTCPAKLCAPPSAEGVQMIAKLVFAQDRQPIPCSQCDGYGCCEHLVSEKGAQACVKDGVADFCNLKLGKEAYGSKYGRALFQWCFEPCDPATRLEFPGLVVHSAPFRAKTKLVRPLADRVDGGKPEQSVPNLDACAERASSVVCKRQREAVRTSVEPAFAPLTANGPRRAVCQQVDRKLFAPQTADGFGGIVDTLRPASAALLCGESRCESPCEPPPCEPPRLVPSRLKPPWLESPLPLDEAEECDVCEGDEGAGPPSYDEAYLGDPSLSQELVATSTQDSMFEDFGTECDDDAMSQYACAEGGADEGGADAGTKDEGADEQAVDEGEDLGDFSDIDEEDIEVESSGLQRSVSVRPPSPHGGPPPSMNPQPCGSAISHTFGSHGTHASASASCCGEPPPFVHSSLAVYAPPSGSFDTDASRFGLL